MDAMTDLHCDGFPQKLRGLLGQVRQLEEQLSLGRDVLHNAGDLLLVVLAPGRTGGWMSIDGWIFFPFPLRQEGLVQVGVPSGGLPRQDGFRPVAEGNQTGLDGSQTKPIQSNPMRCGAARKGKKRTSQ